MLVTVHPTGRLLFSIVPGYHHVPFGNKGSHQAQQENQRLKVSSDWVREKLTTAASMRNSNMPLSVVFSLGICKQPTVGRGGRG